MIRKRGGQNEAADATSASSAVAFRARSQTVPAKRAARIIEDSEKLPDKDPPRFQRHFESDKDCRKLRFLRKWQGEMSVDQVIAREGKLLESRLNQMQAFTRKVCQRGQGGLFFVKP